MLTASMEVCWMGQHTLRTGPTTKFNSIRPSPCVIFAALHGLNPAGAPLRLWVKSQARHQWMLKCGASVWMAWSAQGDRRFGDDLAAWTDGSEDLVVSLESNCQIMGVACLCSGLVNGASQLFRRKPWWDPWNSTCKPLLLVHPNWISIDRLSSSTHVGTRSNLPSG